MAANTTIRVYLAGDVQEWTRRARALSAGLAREGVAVEVVDRLGGLEDLLQMVRADMVELPMWTVAVGGAERLRLRGVPSVREAREWLDRLGVDR